MNTITNSPVLDSTSVAGRASRFAAVTVITATLGQVLIFLFFGILGWNPILSNVIAVLIVAIVGFVISTRFVWTDASPENRRSQIAAFVGSALLGLVVSTLAIQFVTSRVDHALAANIGSAAGYGLVWILRFGVLERYVFGNDHALNTEPIMSMDSDG